MYPFAQSVTPAVRTHMDAQMSFVNDISRSFFRSFQQVCDLNIQLAQTMMEETTLASQQVLSHSRPTDAISAASARAQPAAEKLRAYQQHVSRVAADAQVDLTRVTEQHVQETTRTARELANEVQRVATEETERNMRTQQETMRKFSDPFQNAATRGNGGSASMQSADGGGQMGGSQQGAAAQAAQGTKNSSTGARKDS